LRMLTETHRCRVGETSVVDPESHPVGYENFFCTST
jgi:hypothetical protein